MTEGASACVVRSTPGGRCSKLTQRYVCLEYAHPHTRAAHSDTQVFDRLQVAPAAPAAVVPGSVHKLRAAAGAHKARLPPQTSDHKPHSTQNTKKDKPVPPVIECVGYEVREITRWWMLQGANSTMRLRAPER